MCGIVGIVARNPVNQPIYDALTVLQHRGQDAAGIVTCEGNRLSLRKDNGLVKDVFRTRHMRDLTGNMGIGHVRYPTAGTSNSEEAQPFYVNSPYGITLAHNGNLTNAAELKNELYQTGLRHMNTDSDSEVLLNILADELLRLGKQRVNHEDLFDAVARLHRRCRGAYAVVAMITGFGILAFRDPHGIRPVVFGVREDEAGPEAMVASESVALSALGFDLVRDLEPGEALFINTDGHIHTRQCTSKSILSPCIFEHVYFARPDSIIDGISVYHARLAMGEKLAAKIKRLRPDHDIDVVIPVPDSSRYAALSLAHALDVPYREGLIKNRYIGRTFIMPDQPKRKKSVRQKLNPIEMEFRGKNVMLVDDSVVRGTTSEQIIQMARDAGARKVYFASAAPPVRFPNVYGIDMATRGELVAHGRDPDQVGQAIGADWMVYQDLDDLLAAVGDGSDISRFDDSCFSGNYVTEDVDEAYFLHLEELRSDVAKAERQARKGEVMFLNNRG
ncbi:MAG: amidophosphoribosyltransferase [Gammaproteobacteria bacterium]|nr:amidophosphoribosyltransferase [Gammaproteobacteria bacterium]MCP5137467.1 amidophosphoribosyltransferase [Gammaproteobacteria bacterium]